MEVIINNKIYRKIERKSLSSSRRMNSFMLTSLMFSGIMYDFGGRGQVASSKSNFENRNDSDLIAEYKLILQKKSNLSANQRNRIVYWFERNFNEVIEEEE